MIFWISYIALWLVVVLQGFAFLEVLRQVGYLRREIGPQQGAMKVPGVLDPGTALPELRGLSASKGIAADWDDVLRTERGVVVFLTTHCLTCVEIAEKLQGFARDLPASVSVATVLEGRQDDVVTFINRTNLDVERTVIDEHGDTAEALGIGWRPAAITTRRGEVDEHTAGLAGIVNTIYQIDALIQEDLEGDAREEDDGQRASGAESLSVLKERPLTHAGRETE